MIMIQNARVTTFTVSELLRENQQRGENTPPPPLSILRLDLPYGDKANDKNLLCP